MKLKRPKIKQPTSEELLTGLLELVQTKFYQGEAVEFAKDKRRLLEWVILFPAKWLDERSVTVPADRYRAIFTKVMLDAVRFGDTRKIAYRPAWLAKVIQSHFDCHGDEIYEEAKSMRNLVDHAVMVAGKASQAAPDPVRELADTRRLLKAATSAPKRAIKAPIKEQLSLL